MNRFTRFMRQFFGALFKILSDHLREEQPDHLEDNEFTINEWVGFLGASVWLIVSLGRVKLENDDWRAMTTGGACWLRVQFCCGGLSSSEGGWLDGA